MCLKAVVLHWSQMDRFQSVYFLSGNIFFCDQYTTKDVIWQSD